MAVDVSSVMFKDSCVFFINTTFKLSLIIMLCQFAIILHDVSTAKNVTVNLHLKPLPPHIKCKPIITVVENQILKMNNSAQWKNGSLNNLSCIILSIYNMYFDQILTGLYWFKFVPLGLYNMGENKLLI